MKIKFTDFQREFNVYKKDIIKSVNKVGKSGEYVFGSELIKFENTVKKFLNVKYALGVGNWTEGMVMVCKALNLKKKDEIILSQIHLSPHVVQFRIMAPNLF